MAEDNMKERLANISGKKVNVEYQSSTGLQHTFGIVVDLNSIGVTLQKDERLTFIPMHRILCIMEVE